MAYFRSMLFYAVVVSAVHVTTCVQQENGAESDEGLYDQMTDREIILKLVKQNDALVKSVRDLEQWNLRQQKDIDHLHTTVRKQGRQLRSLGQILVRSGQDSGRVQGETSTEWSHGNSQKSAVKGGRNHGLPKVTKVNSQSPSNRIVERDVHVNGRGIGGIGGPVRQTRQMETINKVAFYATTSDHLQNLGANQVLEFHNTVTNVGNAYSSNTGVFTAPYSGVYVFSVSLMGNSHNDSHFYFAKNRIAVSYLYIRGIESPYTTSSHTVILDLQQGDDVEIRNRDTGEAVYGSKYSCFSGFLLYESDSSGVIVG